MQKYSFTELRIAKDESMADKTPQNGESPETRAVACRQQQY
jgi:hypothetical protein